MSSPLYLLGSARSDGNTRAVVDQLSARVPGSLVDLNISIVHPYDYCFGHDGDAFLEILRVAASSSALVLCSPIYWYAVSAQMKGFIDRLNELQYRHKTLRAQLTGTRCFSVFTGFNPEPPAMVEENLSLMARFLDWKWESSLYIPFNGDDDSIVARAATQQSLSRFGALISRETSSAR